MQPSDSTAHTASTMELQSLPSPQKKKKTKQQNHKSNLQSIFTVVDSSTRSQSKKLNGDENVCSSNSSVRPIIEPSKEANDCIGSSMNNNNDCHHHRSSASTSTSSQQQEKAPQAQRHVVVPMSPIPRLRHELRRMLTPGSGGSGYENRNCGGGGGGGGEKGEGDGNGNGSERRRRRDPLPEQSNDGLMSSASSCSSAYGFNKEDEEGFVKRETRSVSILRFTVLILLLLTATGVCAGAYFFGIRNEDMLYAQEHESNALRVVDSFHRAVQQKLSAIDSFSIDITSYAIQQLEQSQLRQEEEDNINTSEAASSSFFPFVTLPDFEVRGSAARVQSDAVIIHWTPLVTDDRRHDWEKYAYEHRSQIDHAFAGDTINRQQQDESFGYSGHRRNLQLPDPMEDLEIELGQGSKETNEHNMTTTFQPMDDNSTGYKHRIWSGGSVAPRGPEIEGTGPFLPLWQRTPINGGRQQILNLNFASAKVVYGMLPYMLEENVAVMNRATIPLPEFAQQFRANLAISQYRHDFDEIGIVDDDPLTFISYPVFDSFDVSRRKVAGALHTNIYWKLLFKDVLNENSIPTLCVLKNSFNQTLSYLINGPNVEFLGEGDHHNPEFDSLEYATNVNKHIEELTKPSTQSYTSVPLSQDFGVYEIYIYPAEYPNYSNMPWIYALVIAITLVFVSTIYICFTIQVERRQKKMMDRAVNNARKAAAAERELNEFLSHEVRNPLSAAIAACTFVDATLQEQENKYFKKPFTGAPKVVDGLQIHERTEATGDDNDTLLTVSASTVSTPESLPKTLSRIPPCESMEVHKTMRDDVRIIMNSLHFVNDFLRSMLDIHRAAANKLELKLTPADVRKDILEPVCNMLYQRDTNVEINVECPENLIVETDPLRLKQVILNLGRNSTKFVESGFIRLRGEVVDGCVELVVEDSGEGIPQSKRNELFSKYQTSLDAIGQGTGFGLSLCKSLMTILEGDIWLDDTYDSGIDGCPGARFVVRLNSIPLPMSQFDRSVSFSVEDSHIEEDKLTIPVHEENTENGQNDGSTSTRIDFQLELPTNLNVLFVDDDLMLRKLFIRAVKKVAPNWDIKEAASGESAIKMFEEYNNGGDVSQTKEDVSFDLVFMDMYMSSSNKQMLGTEAIRALRSNNVQSIIVGLSANNLESKFISSGADAFIVKPIPCKPNDLKSELLRVIACGDSNGRNQKRRKYSRTLS